jgi:CRISPR-associated protein Cas2
VEAADLDVLKLQIQEVINEAKDKTYIFQMNKKELKQTILLGQAFDAKLITDEVKLLFI